MDIVRPTNRFPSLCRFRFTSQGWHCTYQG